jgi:ribose transport system substrate-binding protein
MKSTARPLARTARNTSTPAHRRSVHIAQAATIVVMAGLLAACSTTSTAATTKAPKRADTKVAFSAPYGIAAFVTYETHEVENTLKSTGYDVLDTTNANQSNAQQVTDIQNLISSGAKGIIVDSNDSSAIVPALTYAQAHQVKVVAVDVSPTSGPAVAAVTADQDQIGVEACQAMAKGVNYTGKVLSLEGSQSTYNGRERTKGFADCMKKYPNITLIQKATNWDAPTQAADVQTVLTSDPDLKGIYQQAGYALSPTLQAIKQAGHYAKAGKPGHIYMVAVDGDPQGLGQIRTGDLDVEISQPALLFAKYGVEYLDKALQDPSWKLPLGKTDHNSTVVMFDGIRTDALPATVVSTANVDDKSLWGNQVKQ